MTSLLLAYETISLKIFITKCLLVTIKEQFVVYLFSKFHKELEFEHIVDIDTQFPDCIAVKKGKRVSIEFEPEASSLATHLFAKSKSAYGHPDYKISETETDIVVTDGRGCTKYPKSDYKAEIATRGYTITEKVWGFGLLRSLENHSSTQGRIR